MRIIPLLALLTCTALMVAADFAEITQADLAKAIEAKTITLIDVNGTESWKAGHIPGALDFAAVAGALADQLPKDKDALIVAYCGGPSCGAWKRGAEAVAALGYTNVKHFKGGVSGWKESGAKTEAAAAPAKAACCGCGRH
jgi:rhodanese-related sulfurtransferase